VIDTHVHHLDLRQFRYPWLGDPEFGELRRDYLPADYRADAGAIVVEGWVHVQADVDHAADPVEETCWISRLADEARASGLPGPLASVVYADLRATNLHETLSRHCERPLTRGVRQEAWFDPGSTRADIPRENFLTDPAWRRGYATLAEFGLSFDLLVWPHQLAQAKSLAAASPDVPVVLEHLGLPDLERDPGLRTWRSGVAAFAELPHAHVKLSAFSLLGTPRDRQRVRPVVFELLEMFGAHRCMFGSNFPVERLAGGFVPLCELVLDILDELPPHQRVDVLAGTARRFYRLPAERTERTRGY
jgi:predicted TIM-barrel fold metal-dependent hydrolase